MKKTSILTLVLGGSITLIGIVPFVFIYPYSNGPNSGPTNGWELLLMISYDVKLLSLIVGMLLLLTSSYLLFRGKRV